jgi:hypothetical protein
MQKLRDIGSLEFLSIIDQVLLSELDLINDYQLESEEYLQEVMKIVQRKAVDADIDAAIAAEKGNALSSLRIKLEHSLAKNHAIFQKSHFLPSCVWQELLHQSI